jgi:CHAT domain-containing protein
MAFSPLPRDYSDAIREINMWRARYKREALDAESEARIANERNHAMSQACDEAHDQFQRAEAENAALREPIPTDDALQIVVEWYDADESGIELIRRVEAWKNARRK